MNITKIEPRWMENWSNSPDIIVEVDEKIDWDTVLWRAVPDESRRENTMLISTNIEPWVRFVYIADPTGNPEFHGALGGNYRMEDGTEFKSRSGWSSRSGVVNRDFVQYLDDEIVEVTLRFSQYSHLAGFHIYKSALMESEVWPEGCYLVREIKFENEPYWHISTTPDVVTKGTGS